MKSIHNLLILSLFVLICGLQPMGAQNSMAVSRKGDLIQEKTWKRFASPALGFSVLMPDKPTAQDQTIENATGNIIHHVYSSEFSNDVFMVTVARFPEAISDEETVKRMLDSGRDKGVSGSNGRLKSEKEITLDGHSGREWELILPKGIRVRSRAYWVSDTLFQLIALTEEKQTAEVARASDERMSKFLDSFALVQRGGKLT
jgi:hypothetical protein